MVKETVTDRQDDIDWLLDQACGPDDVTEEICACGATIYESDLSPADVFRGIAPKCSICRTLT